LSESHKKTKEDEELERLRAKYPDLNIRLATPEERAQHRIFVGRPPVASEAKKKGEEEGRDYGREEE
jgi:hypothetical protein